MAKFSGPRFVVPRRLVRVERELEGNIQVGKRLEPGEQPLGEERPVRERDDGQGLRHAPERLGEVRKHEDLSARDANASETKLLRLARRAHHRIGIQRAPIRNSRRGLSEAVDAGEVAVVSRVEPEAVAHPSLGHGLANRVPHEGGGISNAMQ